MWTRFDVFEYLISLALKPSHHSRPMTTVQTVLATIEAELTKDPASPRDVTSSRMTDRFSNVKTSFSANCKNRTFPRTLF